MIPSRCIVAAQLFQHATSENAVTVLREAIAQFGKPATILSDNGSCFVGGNRRNKDKYKPTLFEAELIDLGIDLINSRPYHSQTNGKIERLFGTIEKELCRRSSLSEYVAFYNERRMHRSLDWDNYETPLESFHKRCATDAIRKSDPKWMKEI